MKSKGFGWGFFNLFYFLTLSSQIWTTITSASILPVAVPTNLTEECLGIVENGTHLIPPSEMTVPVQCQFIFVREPNVCQVRLDFVAFNLSPPNLNGECDIDTLAVAGADNLLSFMACVYLHYGNSNSMSVYVSLNQMTSVFDILPTFINCPSGSSQREKEDGGREVENILNSHKKFVGHPTKNQVNQLDAIVEAAPYGCSQYFTNPFDTVTSFNYQTPSEGPVSSQFQINNERYSVCVKPAAGSNQITWKPCTATNAFVVSGNTIGDHPRTLPCETDYVDIPGSPAGRYCGNTFPSSVVSSAKPYIMYVNFNNEELFGINLPVDPLTGCCLGFCTCVIDGIPALPGTVCGTNGGECVPNQYVIDHSDIDNTGFCLQYRVY